MLAARDQENLVHAHQAAAAAKPANQSSRQFAPKTPGNNVPKTPFKIPMNDENRTVLGKKTGLNYNGKGNENPTVMGKNGGMADKNAFVTPAPKARAPLGDKTTNAKNKAIQTPAPNMEMSKTTRKSAGSRKVQAKPVQVEASKLNVLDDKDELEEREIEYMPPPVQNLPDDPDYLGPEPGFSMFENGGLTRGFLEYFYHKPDAEGVSYVQRKEMREKALYEAVDKKSEAMILRDIESAPFPCLHTPDCPGTECKDMPERRRLAEEKYQRTIAELESSPRKKPSPARGPPTISSKNAVAALSELKPAPKFSEPVTTTRVPDPMKQSKPKSNFVPSTTILSRQKTTPTPLPTNPSTMRHSAAVAASRTTMGYSKGRATSATLKKNTFLNPKSTNGASTSQSRSRSLSQMANESKKLGSVSSLKNEKKEAIEVPDVTLAPALYIQRYGVPVQGSEMWFRCRDMGCFDDEGDEGVKYQESEGLEGSKVGGTGPFGGTGGIDYLEEDALRDFELVL